MSRPGKDSIPEKLVCVADSGIYPSVICLIGDTEQKLRSGIDKLKIPSHLISDNNIVNLEDRARNAIRIESVKKNSPRAPDWFTGIYKVLVVRLSDTSSSPTYDATQIGKHVFDIASGAVSLVRSYLSISICNLAFKDFSHENFVFLVSPAHVERKIFVMFKKSAYP